MITGIVFPVDIVITEGSVSTVAVPKKAPPIKTDGSTSSPSVSPWIKSEDLNEIKINLNDLRALCVALLKEGDDTIGLRDLLWYIRDMYRS